MDRRKFLLGIGGVATGAVTPANAEETEPPWVTTVREFYTFHLKEIHYFGEALRQREKWLSRRLTKAMQLEERQRIRTDAIPQFPHLNADPFTDSQEYPNRFEIGGSHQTRDMAVVDLIFISEFPPEGPVRQRYEKSALIILRLERESWLIDDVVIYSHDSASSLRSFLAEDDRA